MNWWNLLIHVLLVVSLLSLTEATDSDDENVPREQTVDVTNTEAKERPRVGAPFNIVDQIFRQQAFRPSLVYHPGQGINYNLGYNFGRTLGKTSSIMEAPLDRNSDASKVVLVLANDSPKSSAPTVSDSGTHKRLVRSPGVLDEFVATMRMWEKQMPTVSTDISKNLQDLMSQTQLQNAGAWTSDMAKNLQDLMSQAQIQNPGALTGDMTKNLQDLMSQLQIQNPGALTGDMTKNLQDLMSQMQMQNPGAWTGDISKNLQDLLSQNQMQNAGAWTSDMAKNLQDLLSQNQMQNPAVLQNMRQLMSADIFRQTSDSTATDTDTDADTDTTSSARSETEDEAGAPASDSIFGLSSSFLRIPQALQIPLDNMRTALPAWMNLNPEAAASDMSEIRVRPDVDNTYRITPKDVVSQKMAEMKLRAAMKDALDKKTIPILWFSAPTNSDTLLLSDTTKAYKKPMPLSEDEKLMRSKLKAFEKQLIAELKELQEVVRLANAMKKVQVSSKGQKFVNADNHAQLSLHEIPVHKITLADIEKTLEDETVRKLLQMIQNSQHKNKNMRAGTGFIGGINTEYTPDFTGNPFKRQATKASDAMSHINKDDMMQMMAFAYRMAAASGKEVPWQSDDTDHSKGISTQKETSQRQWANPQQTISMSQFPEQRNMFEQMNMQQDQARQRQMSQQQFQQALLEHAKQRQWIESNLQMNQQQPQQAMMDQNTQRQWFESNAQMNKPSFQQTAAQQPQQRQWFEQNEQMNQPLQNQRQMPMQMRLMVPPNTGMQMRQWFENPNGPMAKSNADMEMPQQRQMLPSNINQNADSNKRNSADSSQNEEAPTKELKSTIHAAADQISNVGEHQMMGNHETEMPSGNEATPQMPENAGQERHKGLEDFLDDFNLFGHSNSKKSKDKDKKQGTTINYYYNNGGSRYPPIYGGYGPQSQQNYGYYNGGNNGGYAPQQYYSSKSGYYGGGGGYGSNAYGSHGGYRTAVGDEEIEEMLRQHQTLPKMMLLMPGRDNNPQPTIANSNIGTSRTIASLDVSAPPSSPSSSASSSSYMTPSSAADVKAGLRRLAKRLAYDKNLRNLSSFVVVIRPRHKSKRRSKRSTEYASLEPIDESSLNELRKTYKNTLKEITLNPNETPAEALMRYNAESVREALAKATKEPMEISAGGDHDDADNNVSHDTVQHSPPPSYSLDNEAYVSAPSTAAYNQNHAAASSMHPPQQQQYVSQLKAQYASPSPMRTYNTAAPYQHQSYTDMSALYPYQTKTYSNGAYSTPSNNLIDHSSYVDDYTVSSNPYQQYQSHNSAQHGVVNTASNHLRKNMYSSSPYVKTNMGTYHPRVPQTIPHLVNALSRPSVHQSSSASYGNRNYASDMYQRKGPQERGHMAKSYHDKESYKIHSKASSSASKGLRAYDRDHRQKDDENVRYNEDSVSNLYEAMKERLAECCNECKEKLLNDLTETLKRQLQKQRKPKEQTSRNAIKNHYAQLDREQSAEDDKFGDWVNEMVDKGFDKQYLTREHQKHYKNNDRIHLAIDGTEGPEEEYMHDENQSYKRDTTVAETDSDKAKHTNAVGVDVKDAMDADIDFITAEPSNPNKLEKRENDSQSEEVDSVNFEDVESADSINDKLENVSISEEPKEDPKVPHLEPAESTTHSVYALRGQYKPRKHHTIDTLTKMYGKKIAGYKNLKLLGDTKSLNKFIYLNNDVSKVITKKDVEKHENIEEILDLLYELSKARHEMNKDKTATSNPLTSTSTNDTTTRSDKTEPSIENENKQLELSSTPAAEKPKRRKHKSSVKPHSFAKSFEGTSKPKPYIAEMHNGTK